MDNLVSHPVLSTGKCKKGLEMKIAMPLASEAIALDATQSKSKFVPHLS
ncbi:hypothetical protein [Nostoc sp. ChiVER01]|nr:hypothetical protein [Nostoc sp. ChiVER01]MDZ8226912.1 hypothetical protein [Nostoc sp. ChiVER01]